MHRFFCSPQNITAQEIQILDKEELHHMTDVLRLESKDKLVVLDGQGQEFLCQIKSIDKNCAKLNIIKKQTFQINELLPRLTVACAMPKKSKIGFIVDKLTEIGVEKIILLKTERTEINLKDYEKKTKRLEKIALASLKQSGNLFLPQIAFLGFSELLEFKKREEFDLALIPNLTSETEQGFKEILEKALPKRILLAIGPEGDFSENEIKLARQAGFIPVSLGDTVLKVDTAAIVATGFIKLCLSRGSSHCIFRNEDI